MKTRQQITDAKKKCSCGALATKQTVRGAEAEEAKHHPNNFGYYCDKCYEEGLQIEKEAMGGWY